MGSLEVPGLMEAVTLAINNNDWTPVRTLLEITIAKDSVEYTQLQQIDVSCNLIEEACSRGFTELLSIFLNNGLQANCIVNKRKDRRMLHVAAVHGHLSLVKLLLNVGADIDSKACKGETPLFWAVRKGHLEVVRHLISTGADINTCSKHGITLLDAAYLYETVTEEMLQLLLDSGCDPAKYNYSCSPLYCAVFNKKLNQVQMLLDAGAHVNGTAPYIPLHKAAKHGSIPIMELLLEYGADINITDSGGNTALHQAIIFRNLQSVEFLIEHGSLINSVNSDQETPLLVSIRRGHFGIAMLLVNSGAQLDLDIHHDLLHRVIHKYAYVELIECLLEHGANVTTVYYNNKTALQYVISYIYSNKDLHIVKLLLIYGSDHYVEDDYGNTLLHWACIKGDVGLVEYLIYYGLNVDAKNTEGMKPYDIAVEKGHTNIVKVIIHYHCNKYTRF